MHRYLLSSLLLITALILLLQIGYLEAGAHAESELVAGINFLSNSAGWYFESGQSGADLGFSVHAAGDLDSDGYADIVIGSPLFIPLGENEKDGAAFVFYGTPGGLPGTPDHVLAIGRQASRFGCSVSSAGDVDGDGYDDLLVGAEEYQITFEGKNGEPKSGAAFLYMGSVNGLSENPALTLLAEAPEIQFGHAVSGSGDVNQDGYDDVLVSAPGYESSKGKVYLFLGSENGLSETPVWTYQCSQAASKCGESVSSAGDLNNDGFDDVIIGAPFYDNLETDEGAALLFLGSAQGLGATPIRIYESNQVGAEFGISVASAGDVDGDGYDDLMIGAPHLDRDESSLNVGGAFLYLGSPTGPGPGFDRIIYGLEQDDLFGNSVGSAGDINRDGFADVLIGAYRFGQNGSPINQPDEGAVFLYMGSTTGLTETPSWSAAGGKADTEFGFSAGNAGDINGDGGPDIIVGAPNFRYDEKTVMGRAFVYFNTLEDFKEFNYHIFIPFIN